MTGFGSAPFGTSAFGGSSAPTVTPPAPGVVDPRMSELLRGPHFAYGFVEAWSGGALVPFAGEDRLPLIDGSVEVDGGTAGARRTLAASFAPVPGLWEALVPGGVELRAFSVLRGPNGVEQVYPQGVFDIDAISEPMGGDVKVTGVDRWMRVRNARFLRPKASNKGATIRSQIAALLLEALPAGSSVTDLGTSAATVPAQVWDRDRDKAIEELAKAASLDVFFDATGAPTIRDVPTLDAENVAWTVDAGELGVMVSADRERNRQRTYNVVVVNGEPVDDVPPFPTQFVWDSAVGSATYAGPDPVNSPELAGPFGVRPTFYTSPLLQSESQALVAGHTILDRVTALHSQLSLSTVTKPDLSDGDTILVKLPPEYPRGPQALELHLVDRLTIPLRPSKGSKGTPMQIGTRSTAVGYEGAQ